MKYDDSSSKKYSKRNHIKNKSSKNYYDDEDSLSKRANKQFRQKKKDLQENEDWEEWDYKNNQY